MRDFDRIRTNKLQREAEGYLELRLPGLALGALARLSEVSRQAASSLYLQGEALRELARYEEAVPPLRQASKLEPENTHICVALAWCYKRTGRLHMAIGAIEQALAADPNEALLHYNLACYLSLAQRKDESLDHLSRALVLEPQYRFAVDGEADFDPIRSDPEFQALTSIVV